MTKAAAEEVIDYDQLSDEEFNKLPIPSDDVNEITEDENKEVTDDNILQETDASAEGSQEVEESSETEEETRGQAEETEESETEKAEVEFDEKTDSETKAEKETSKEDTKVNSLDELLKTPLKIGDTEITVNSAEELVVLAQRGLGANKRVQELAPKLRLISMLENNELMDPEKLNFLIALDKKDPAAIKKLVASSGIDPLDVTAENAEEEYTPVDYSVSDSEFALEEAFNTISTTDSYQDTLKTITGFDNASKAEIQKDPSVITQLNAHHADGTYQQIAAIVAKDRALGNLQGVSDFAAYKHVWDTVQEHLASTAGGQEAGHKNVTNDQNSQENLAGTEGTQEAGHKTNTDTQVGNALAAARKAAEATNTSRGSRKKAETINFDDLSDEEIMKLEVSDVFND